MGIGTSSEWVAGDPYTGLSRAVEVESILRVARDPTGAGFSTSQMRLRDNDNHIYG